jgi:hypothetical protein
VTDQPTIRQRCLNAGLSPERIEHHLAEGRLCIDGETVTDLEQPTEPGSRITLWGS